jgi:hypothetical protein
MKVRRPTPDTKEAWLEELACAYSDAREALVFDPELTEDQLFHMAPSVCLKFRGIRKTKANLKRATDAALASYVATQEVGTLYQVPQMAFALCYLASHLGLEVLRGDLASEALEHAASNKTRFLAMTDA